MSGIFSQPKIPTPITPPNPADTANRFNMALVRQLQSGGSASTMIAPGSQPTSATTTSKAPTVTGNA